MPTSLRDAFANLGLRAEYKGQPALLLPVTDELAGDLDAASIRQGVAGGQMLVSWNDGERRNGAVIDAGAKNDIYIFVRRTDGSDLRIAAGDMMDATLSVLGARNTARDNAAKVAEANAKARADYEAARGRGETPAEPEDRQPVFAENAFDRVPGFVACVLSAVEAARSDDLATEKEISELNTFMASLRELTRDELTSAERARADEAARLRAEIAMLAPGHAEARGARMPAAYEGDGEAARDLMESLPSDPNGLTAAQSSIMARSGNMDLARRLFSVATTTPLMQIERRALSHTGFKTFAQELARHENKAAGEAILPRIRAVTADGMPGYEDQWRGKIYTKDGADILLMRDRVAAYAYAWDSASRIAEINVDAALLRNFTAEDVPSEADLEALRAIKADLRHDNGAEVDFDWDDEDEEVLEDDGMDVGRGPRPAGY
ncbi:hypothetical protein [Defluviimonas salinarum]|uniref:Uncharacterized protein n=1 Tax=Defluviimonas salinarum TaxID=2992147 RepID=A0ABT3J7A5_9RHOB|nr:hypothetical protein [Defluviimonas salinarum]MCW3783573.1 hypothetical protein [Defluviimonas salinarum]